MTQFSRTLFSAAINGFARGPALEAAWRRKYSISVLLCRKRAAVLVIA